MAFEDLLVQISSKLDDKGFKALDKMESKAQRKTDMLSRSLKRMFVGVLGTLAVKSIVDATVKLDTLNRSLAALAGSEAGGQSQFEYLRKEADRLGQSFIVVADAYKNLFAAGTGAGWNEKDIQGVFSSVLEAGTVLGSSQQQISGALVALEQMISKGKVSMEELRRQLGNALPGAMQIAAKAMGVTSEELEEMLKSGLRSEEFVKKFANTLHSEYGEKVPAAAKSLRAELARLETALFFLQTAMLADEGAEGLASAIREITKLISSPEFLKSLNAIGSLVAFLAKNLKLIIGVAVIIGFKRLTDAIALLRLELLTATFAAGSLGSAMQLIIGGSVVAGIRALTAASIAMLAPWLRLALILGLIIELFDTLRGKDTATSEFFKNLPTAKEVVEGEKFQTGWHKFKGTVQRAMPWHKEAPVLRDSGMYNKDGTRKTSNANNATIIINAGGTDPQAVASLVKSTVSDMFNDYEEVYT